MSLNVVTFSPGQRCIEALRYLRKQRIRRAPVLEDARLVGIVTERDLYRVLPQTFWQASQDGEAGIDVLIRDVMATDVHVVSPNDHMETAASLMLKHKIGGMPVVKDGKLKGLITESDIFRAMWSILSGRANYRILFFEKGEESNKSANDYIGLCLNHHCQIHTFISYPKPDGGYMHYLCIQGTGGDDLIKDLWAHSCEVVIVERDDRAGRVIVNDQ